MECSPNTGLECNCHRSHVLSINVALQAEVLKKWLGLCSFRTCVRSRRESTLDWISGTSANTLELFRHCGVQISGCGWTSASLCEIPPQLLVALRVRELQFSLATVGAWIALDSSSQQPTNMKRATCAILSAYTRTAPQEIIARSTKSIHALQPYVQVNLRCRGLA